MSSMWNKTLFYLGLVDEDEKGVATVASPSGSVTTVAPTAESQMRPPSAVAKPGSGIAGRRIEPPDSTRQRFSEDRAHAEAGVYIHPTAASAATAGLSSRRTNPESHVIVARNFSDAQTLADAIRSGRSVVLDLRSTEPEMVRRIVDFTSGLTYALGGKMVKTSQGVILVTPTGVSLGEVEQDRLAGLGLFDTQE